jgi:hypothetical protein
MIGALNLKRLAALLLALMAAVPANAWNATGHEVIALIGTARSPAVLSDAPSEFVGRLGRWGRFWRIGPRKACAARI